MVSVENLSVEFSATPLFTDVSFVINDTDRIALVGKKINHVEGAVRPTETNIRPRVRSFGTVHRLFATGDDPV